MLKGGKETWSETFDICEWVAKNIVFVLMSTTLVEKDRIIWKLEDSDKILIWEKKLFSLIDRAENRRRLKLIEREYAERYLKFKVNFWLYYIVCMVDKK